MIEKVRLGELCRIQGGYAFKSNQFQKNNIPIIRIGNIQENKVLIDNDICYTKEFLNSHPEFEIKNGDLLIAMSGATVGKVGIYSSKESALLNQRVGKFVITDKIESRYLYFLLLSPLFEKFILNNAFGCAQPNISNKQIEEFKFNKYSIETQIEIANKLDKVQEIIDLRKKQTEELDELIKSQFVEMFGDPITNSKNFRIKKSGDICKIYRGASPRPINNYLNGTVPWIKIGDATKGDNVYLYNTKEKITEDGAKKSKLIKKGSLIFANCGVSLGFARIIKFDGCIHDGWLAFENYEKELNPIFFLQSLNFCTEHFRAIAPDGTQPNLNTDIMKNHLQILPDMKTQLEFVEFCKKIDQQKLISEKNLKETEELQESLMNKYFGE